MDLLYTCDTVRWRLIYSIAHDSTELTITLELLIQIDEDSGIRAARALDIEMRQARLAPWQHLLASSRSQERAQRVTAFLPEGVISALGLLMRSATG
jgi:hypothetical protein|eukprot:3513241-Prymnesium_polylepis.1